MIDQTSGKNIKKWLGNILVGHQYIGEYTGNILGNILVDHLDHDGDTGVSHAPGQQQQHVSQVTIFSTFLVFSIY